MSGIVDKPKLKKQGMDPVSMIAATNKLLINDEELESVVNKEEAI